MLFRNEEFNLELKEKGFIKIPFIDSNELLSIKEFYYSQNCEDEGKGIFMTSFSSNMEYKLKVGSFLKPAFEERMNHYFKPHRALNNIFIVKHPGLETTMDIHQDWSIVDESRYWSAIIWVPLEDVNENNGAMWMLEGSHNLDQRIRGGGVITPIYKELLDLFKSKVQPLTVKAGEAVVFFHSTLHGSYPNISNKSRIVATTSIVPQDAPLRIYFQKTSDSNLELYEATDDFMYNYNNIRSESGIFPPKGKLISSTRPYKLNEIPVHQIEDLIAAQNG